VIFLKNKGIMLIIEEEILKGVSTDILKQKYNQATITKVKNKLLKKQELKENISNNNKLNNEIKIYDLLQQVISILNDSGEYIINIRVNKKERVSISKVEKVDNPFKLYGELGKEGLEEKLINMELSTLENIIKKHFNYQKKQLEKIKSPKELADLIIINIERAMKIGESFR